MGAEKRISAGETRMIRNGVLTTKISPKEKDIKRPNRRHFSYHKPRERRILAIRARWVICKLVDF